MVPLTIRAATGHEKELTVIEAPKEFFNGLPNDPMTGDVAQIYKRLAYDIRNNTRTAPSFEDDLSVYCLLDRIEESSKN